MTSSPYLAGVSPELARQLSGVNAAGLARLRQYLDAGDAVAFLGAGVSAPLYPLWTGVIADLVNAAKTQGLSPERAATMLAAAADQPDAAVELVRRDLGVPRYRAVLRDVFRVRRDPDSGRTWTPTHELVCRAAFKAVVTTNYDPGILDARIRVRSRASFTGFTSWTDEIGLDRWRTGDVFGDDELPVLFAHGHHNQPDAMVLATTEYRRAYVGKLSRVLSRMVDAGHLVWIGFSFADHRITAILREVAEHSGTSFDPGAAPRHVAIMAWDPESGKDPQTLRGLAEISYGADLVLYPAPGNDHSALQALLAEFTDTGFPAVSLSAPPAPKPPPEETRAVSWMPPAEPVPHFTGRTEELSRLSFWAQDPAVRLIGVTAWGGAGKTALVTHWLERAGGADVRDGVRGVFGWSFYADPSADHWATSLLEWAAEEFDLPLAGRTRLATAVLAVLKAVPLVLVLDGLEVVQEGPDGGQFGRLLDGTLREVLTGACHTEHSGLVVLTSRFPFADLEAFDGSSVRMLDVPSFTPEEGSGLIAASGGGWLADAERRDLVARVDGHALAVAALGGVLAGRPATADVASLREELAAAAGTTGRVVRVLRFYAERLSEADRLLVAAVALFSRPVTPDAVLAVARHTSFGDRLGGWTALQVQRAARGRLAGLLSWHPDGTLAAHPLVRDTFRSLALGAAEVAANLTLTDLPAGTITTRDDGLRVVEAIELLLSAQEWQAAHDLHSSRTSNGRALRYLPAARLGLRAALAFVVTAEHRRTCAARLGERPLGFFLNEVGLCAMLTGDMAIAREFLHGAIAHDLDAGDPKNTASALLNLTGCLGYLGETATAMQTAEQAAAEARQAGDSTQIKHVTTQHGWVLETAGETAAAEERFLAADRISLADTLQRNHLYSINGSRWAEFLARTGRPGPARRLTELNHSFCSGHGWNQDVARCDRILAMLDLAEGKIEDAFRTATAVAATFRDGDYLVHLADTLTLLASCARASGDLDAAEQHVTEVLALAPPRGLVPAHAAALTVRAHIFADRAAAGTLNALEQGRDAAGAALRLATRHQLAWCELDALEAYARLDDNGWSDRAGALRARLIPEDLDPDPLITAAE